MRVSSISDLPLPPAGKTGWPWAETDSSRILGPARDESLPSISVVTPSLNQAEYIEETIRSVLLQGYPNLEYIVIDGGSTDGTVEIIKKYLPWLTYWVSEPDGGQSDALNKGFARATGDLLGWQNSDDIYLPNAFRRMADEFLRYPDCGVVFGNVVMIDRDGRFIREQRYTRFSWYCLLAEGLNVSNQSALWRHSAHARAGALDVNLHYEMDLDFFLRLGEIASFRFVRQAFGCMRIHENAKTQSAVLTSEEKEGMEIRQQYPWWGRQHAGIGGLLRLLCLVRRTLLYTVQGDLGYVVHGAMDRVWQRRSSTLTDRPTV
jgi:glycosyltransferase involved in cell wall biosynthesis